LSREQLSAAVSDLAALRRDPLDREHLGGALRAFRTLNRSVALFEMAPAGLVLHAAEDAQTDGPTAAEAGALDG
jgi:hypothetical protein